MSVLDGFVGGGLSLNDRSLIKAMAAQIGGAVADGRKFPKFAKGLQNVANRIKHATILIVSDSTGAGGGDGPATGPGSGASSASPNMKRSRAWPSLMRLSLEAQGYPTRADAVVGTGNISNYASPITDITSYYDASPSGILTINTDWSAAGVVFPGGRGFQNAVSGSVATLDFKPAKAANRFQILSIPLAQTLITDVDNGTSAPILTIPISSFAIRSDNADRDVTSLKKISIQKVVGNTTGLYVAAIVPRDRWNPVVEIINASGYGMTTGQWALNTNSYDPAQQILNYTPDLTVIDLGLNDASGAVPVATSRANLVTIINAALTTGDVLLCIPNKSWGQSGTGFDISNDYMQMILSLVIQFSLNPAVNFYAGPNWVASDFFDAIGPHMALQGQQKKSDFFSSKLIPFI